MANFSTDWPFHLAAALLGLLSAFILYRSLLHNRSRGRRRCPKCWYDMSGADASRQKGLVCPECGRDAKRERRLYKTRKRWGWAAIGFALAIAAYAAVMTPHVRRDGFLPHTPTAALIVVLAAIEPPPVNVQNNVANGLPLPVTATGSERAFFELVSRAKLDAQTADRGGTLWTWQRRAMWRIVLSRERAALERAAPPVYPIFDPIIGGLRLHDPYADRVYTELVAGRLVYVRNAWPAHVPLAYALDPYQLYRLEGDRPRNITVTPRIAGSAAHVENIPARSPGQRPSWFRRDRHFIGSVPAGQRRIEFEIEVREDGRPVWRGAAPRFTSIGGAPDEVILPLRGARSDAEVSAIPVAIYVCEDSGRAMLHVEIWRVLDDLRAALDGVAIGVGLEILRGETPIPAFREAPHHRATAWTRIGKPHDGPLAWSIPLSAEMSKIRSTLCLRLTSDPIAALNAFGAAIFWSGDTTRPLRIETCPREDFDARFKVGEYLLPGTIDPWADPPAALD